MKVDLGKVCIEAAPPTYGGHAESGPVWHDSTVIIDLRDSHLTPHEAIALGHALVAAGELARKPK